MKDGSWFKVLEVPFHIYHSQAFYNAEELAYRSKSSREKGNQKLSIQLLLESYFQKISNTTAEVIGNNAFYQAL